MSTSTIENDLQQRVKQVEEGLAVGGATQAGAQATQAAAQVGMSAAVISGAVSFVTGMLLGLLIVAVARD